MHQKNVSPKRLKLTTEIDVVVLCGGLGTRFKSVLPDTPKILAPIHGQPFLAILLGKLSLFGFKRAILCVGHLKDQIISYTKENNLPMECVFSIEETPLGTGGALKNAESICQTDPVLVLNGDTLGDIDFRSFYDFHILKSASLSVVLAKPRKEADYGNVRLQLDGRIVDFIEKSGHNENTLINAGAYLVNRELFTKMQPAVFSLEKDFFPKILAEQCYGFIYDGEIVDIGTPQRYKEAHEHLHPRIA